MAVTLVALLAVISAPDAGATETRNRYIIVLKDSVDHPAVVAERHAENRAVEVGHVYRYAIKGYSADLPEGAVEALRQDPSVAYIEPDLRGGIAVQEIPTGIDRIFAASNETLSIDEDDDNRIDVDVAVFDTGTAKHPDLDVVSQVNCNGSESCVEGGTDGHGHGTHVAGTIAAIDNGFGVVGVAPGARIWSVKVLDDGGSGNLSEFIAGIDWVTARADQIEVTNASLRYWGETSSKAFSEALDTSIDAGVVHVAAAGNESEPVQYVPGIDLDEITVSALEDFDGSPGEGNDPLAGFSNYGNAIDVVAPGVDILSTVPGGYEGGWSGTSMASPHVAGAAAILASQADPESREDVEAIRDTIVEEGNFDWEDTSGDGKQEPLLDVSNESVFNGSGSPPPPPSSSETPPPTYSSSVGSNGSGNGQFKLPSDVEIDTSNGNLLVADRSNNRIQRFNSKGEYLSQFGSEGTGNGQFKAPRSVAVDSKGNIWVADSGNHRIQKFNSKGEFLLKCGSQGSSNGQFSSWGPKGIAVDATDSVWVTDYSSRAQKFNSSCEFLKSVSGFSESAGIDVGGGEVWISDWLASKVKVFNEAGETLFEFGSAGSGNGQLDGPDGVEVDSKGNVWVLETENDRVQQFSQAGEYLSQFGSAGSGEGQFSLSYPVNLTSDGKGALWIADNGNSRVQKWLVPHE